MNERLLPEAALQGPNSVEMLRVGGWRPAALFVESRMYRDGTGIDEEVAWGAIPADAARHIVKALKLAGI